MTLQELVNKLSNMLASTPGSTSVQVQIGGNQGPATELVIQKNDQGEIIVIQANGAGIG